MRARFTLSLVVLLALSPGAGRAPEAQDDPAALLRVYWAEPDAQTRSALAGRLAALRDYRPARLREWLHRGVPFPALAPGTQTVTVDALPGETRRVVLVIPDGYRPDRAWPLVYALHPSGQPPGEWAEQVRYLLGLRVHAFVIASPEYRRNDITAQPGYAAEHAGILDGVARQVHVDADRVFALGYSRGGFAAWHVALFFPDRLAAAVSLAAGFDVAPADDGFWKQFVRNVAHLPVLNAWGERDTLVIRDIARQPAGTFAESNRAFERGVRGLGLPITNIEVEGGAHNSLRPPADAILDLLARRRAADPPRVSHVFRHLEQASSYWLEGLTWEGASWGDPPPAASPGPGETEAAALARAFEPLLGRLTGVREGQMLHVTRRHIGDLVVWFGERSINWNQPVVVECDGKVVFSGRVAPDVELALARARATMDFENLRFAGIRVNVSGEAAVVTAATLPEPAWRR